MEYKADELKKDLIEKRCYDLNITMDDASKVIGISKATLSRLEKSRKPDMITFVKVCKWLGKHPSNYFSEIN